MPQTFCTNQYTSIAKTKKKKSLNSSRHYPTHIAHTNNRSSNFMLKNSMNQQVTSCFLIPQAHWQQLTTIKFLLLNSSIVRILCNLATQQKTSTLGDKWIPKTLPTFHPPMSYNQHIKKKWFNWKLTFRIGHSFFYLCSQLKDNSSQAKKSFCLAWQLH